VVHVKLVGIHILGIGAQVKDGLSIGPDVIVGMGSVVYKSIPNLAIVLGRPARPMRRNEDKKVFKNKEKELSSV